MNIEQIKNELKKEKYTRWYDKEYCMEAVKQNGNALQYAEFQDKDIIIEAVYNP